MNRDELCAWLRANSSGIYRPAADAADEIEQLLAELDALKAERDALRADAERYRWLRDVAWSNGALVYFDMRYGNEEWDERIDAALKDQA